VDQQAEEMPERRLAFEAGREVVGIVHSSRVERDELPGISTKAARVRRPRGGELVLLDGPGRMWGVRGC